MSLNALEQNARRAKEACSFSDYKPGSATAEYNGYCAEAESIANNAKERLTKKGAPAEWWLDKVITADEYRQAAI